MRIVYTFYLFYEFVLIQEQSYDHASNNTCLFTYKSPSDGDDDVYWSKQAVIFMKIVLNWYTNCDCVLLYVIRNVHRAIKNWHCKLYSHIQSKVPECCAESW